MFIIWFKWIWRKNKPKKEFYVCWKHAWIELRSKIHMNQKLQWPSAWNVDDIWIWAMVPNGGAVHIKAFLWNNPNIMKTN